MRARYLKAMSEIQLGISMIEGRQHCYKVFLNTETEMLDLVRLCRNSIAFVMFFGRHSGFLN